MKKEKGPNSKISLPNIFENFYSTIDVTERIDPGAHQHIVRQGDYWPAVIRGAYPHKPGILERMGLRCRPYDPGQEIAAFSSHQEAQAYLDWALGPGPRAGRDPICRRFRSDSLLRGMDRAWITSLWVKLPLDPPIR